MCGIVGVLSKSHEIDEVNLIEMRDTLIHRGPDGAGIYINDDKTCGFGHRRLAILDLSALGSQPMVSNDNRFVITFNGEIYNYDEIKKELSKLRYYFSSNSDTEVLLNAYAEWGEDCLLKLRGMFSFAIWDNVEKRLFAARDRTGEKPFYYYIKDKTFVFASELKAILKYKKFKKQINNCALIDYFCFGYIPAPKAVWQDCYKLPAGCYMILDYNNFNLEVKQYWDIDFTPDYGKTEAYWIEGIREKLKESVGIMLKSDVALGAFLSSGVDSGAVVSNVCKYFKNIDTFTIGFQETDFDERLGALRVAKLYNTNHTEKVINVDDISAVFSKMLFHYDEPFNDFSYFPSYYICNTARNNITVALTGDGGDELFGGYGKFKRLNYLEKLNKLTSPDIRKLLISPLMWMFDDFSRKKRNLRRFAMTNNEAIFDLLCVSFENRERDLLINSDFKYAVSDYNPQEEIEKLLNQPKVLQWDVFSQARYLDFKISLSEDMLTKVDRASMANSLETRLPFLERDFIDFVSHIPSEFICKNGISKYILKKSQEGLVPNENLYGKKSGFGIPLGRWINRDLSFLIDTIGMSGYFTKEYIDLIISKNRGNPDRVIMKLHNILFFERWVKLWNGK